MKKGLQHKSLKQVFDEHKIWQNKRQSYSDYLNRFEIEKLYITLAQLTDIEINLKNNSQLRIWDELASLTMQFMGLN